MMPDRVKTALEFLQRYTLGDTNVEPGSARESIRRYTIAGVAVVAFLTLGVGVWAATVEIAGALIAPGTVVVESNIKKVQHPTGGVVGELVGIRGAMRESLTSVMLAFFTALVLTLILRMVGGRFAD